LCLTSNRNFDLEDVHVEGAERIAEAVAKYDVDRFIHVSSHNANVDSTSEFFRTKVSKKTASMKVRELMIVTGTWRKGCPRYLPRDHYRATSTNVRF